MNDRASKPPSLRPWANELVAVPKIIASPSRRAVSDLLEVLADRLD